MEIKQHDIITNIMKLLFLRQYLWEDLSIWFSNMHSKVPNTLPTEKKFSKYSTIYFFSCQIMIKCWLFEGPFSCQMFLGGPYLRLPLLDTTHRLAFNSLQSGSYRECAQLDRACCCACTPHNCDQTVGGPHQQAL